MPVPVDELTNSDSFPIKPESNEYDALSFLVAHHKYGFSISEITARTDLSKANTPKTMTRLSEKGLVERSENVYYIDPRRVNEVKQRLDSLDSVIQLFESTPTDDSYAEEGWEEELPSIDPDKRTEVLQEDFETAEGRAEDLVEDIEDCCTEE